jgi:hypothetical protein
MTPTHGNGADVPHLEIRIPDFEVSWAGKFPLGRGFCFGSDDGKIALTDEEGVPWLLPLLVSASGEAVNGIAGFGNWLAISTRAEVTLWGLPIAKGQKQVTALIPHGAFGVAGTSGGNFVAPIGIDGVLEAKPDMSGQTDVTIHSADEKTMSVYRLISIPFNGGDLVVAACRSSGVASSMFMRDGRLPNVHLATLEGVDVIDVCPIATSEFPTAVAAVGKDGTLVFIKRPLSNESSLTTKFEKVKGTVYRILSCRGHIFVLTSDGLFMLANCVERFLGDDAVEAATTHIFVMPMEAVDANLYLDRWLLVTMLNCVWRIDIESIHESIPTDFDVSRSFAAQWQFTERVTGGAALMCSN